MDNFWLDFISQPLGGFVVILIGTFLLFGEVLVKGRFILGLTGFVVMSLYFTHHVQDGQALWMAGLYILGILLLVIDAKFIGDGTAGVIGVLLMIIALAIPSPTVLYGAAVVTAFIFGAFCSLLLMKILPKRDLWSKLTLKDELTEEKGYTSLRKGYKELEGKEGMAMTDFRPSGTMRVEGEQHSAVSDGEWIGKDARIKVINVSGARILVRRIEEKE